MLCSFVNSATVLLALGYSLVEAGILPTKREQVVTVTQTITIPSPEPTTWKWDAGGTKSVPIHPSCNATERALLQRGLDDAFKLAEHARDHILRFGNSSRFYQKYFGAAATAEPVGWYDRIVNGDKTGAWFRCDDIDENCHQDGWAGHWRGENATMETVICPLSFSTRLPLEGLCGYGYDVANGPLNVFFGPDLLHRLFHIPTIGEGAAAHSADSYADCLLLAIDDAASAVRNTHSLQYFALDVYAFDVSLPGKGCTGVLKTEGEDREEQQNNNVTTITTSAVASHTATTDVPSECHTHGDGQVHCD